jgi:hypothetical protein
LKLLVHQKHKLQCMAYHCPEFPDSMK